MRALSSLLDLARGRRRPPEEPRAGAEARVKEVLDALADETVADDARVVGPGWWIFTRRPDRETYLQAIMLVFEEELDRERERISASVTLASGESCACRCRAHGRHGCPVCFGVERCPVHCDPDPSEVAP